ncbi:MAG: type IV secretion system protein [Alphaproteobacteria bacterium]
MANGQQPADTLHDNAIGAGILLFILAVAVIVFWYFFHHEVRDVVRWIRYSEMWVVSWFVGDDYTVLIPDHDSSKSAGDTHALRKVNWNYNSIYGEVENWREINWRDYFHGFDVDTSKGSYHFKGVDEFKGGGLTYFDLSRFSYMAMEPLKNVIVGILGFLSFWAFTLGPRTQFRRKFNLEGLIARQSSVFPVIAPFVKFNPATQPPRPPGAPVPAELPLFGEALGPEEWLAYNNISVPDGKIDEDSAAEAFKKQLGKPWRGVKNLDPHKKILLAAFCLKASRKRADSDEILARAAGCWSFAGGFNLSKDSKLLKKANAVLKDKKLAGKTLAQCNRHAYEATAMIRALQFAREEGGVLAPATFVWLRAHDRNLWYPLNNVGRQSFHMEALGAMSHFKSEKMTQRPIPVHKVESAVDTISEYMKSPRARPIPQLDYSQSKKRGVKKAV